jgi:hypothetical protein
MSGIGAIPFDVSLGNSRAQFSTARRDRLEAVLLRSSGLWRAGFHWCMKLVDRARHVNRSAIGRTVNNEKDVARAFIAEATVTQHLCSRVGALAVAEHMRTSWRFGSAAAKFSQFYDPSKAAVTDSPARDVCPRSTTTVRGSCAAARRVGVLPHSRVDMSYRHHHHRMESCYITARRCSSITRRVARWPCFTPTRC